LPPWLNTADLALFNTSSDEPENGILKLQDILKAKIYIGIRSWNSTQKNADGVYFIGLLTVTLTLVPAR